MTRQMFGICVASLAAVLTLTVIQAEEQKGTVVTIDGLSARTPEGWKEIDVEGRFGRFKQFSLPRAGEDKADAELIISFFGTGSGGGVDANVQRWKAMFRPPDGKTIDDVAKVEKLEVGTVKITYLDVAGTYLFKLSPMAQRAEPRPNHRMIAVVFASPQGPYFMRLVGPEKTVTHHKKAFDEWLKSFK